MTTISSSTRACITLADKVRFFFSIYHVVSTIRVSGIHYISGQRIFSFLISYMRFTIIGASSHGLVSRSKLCPSNRHKKRLATILHLSPQDLLCSPVSWRIELSFSSFLFLSYFCRVDLCKDRFPKKNLYCTDDSVSWIENLKNIIVK